jgi:VWFA-related protein
MFSCGKNAGFDSVEEVPVLSFTALSDLTPVFILFDALSIPPPVQSQTAKQLLSYLRKAADERLAVTLLVNSGRGLEVIHDMSTDEKVFLAAVDRVLPEKKSQRMEPPATQLSDDFTKSVSQEVRQLQELTKILPYASSYKTTRSDRLSAAKEDEARRALEKQELESLRQTGEVFRRSRKRKLLIWLAGYFPINVANGELTYGNYAMPYGRVRPKIHSEMTSLYQGAVDSLNDSRITLYPVFVPDAHNFNIEVLAKDTLDGMEELARRTGGRMLGVLGRIDLVSTIGDVRKQFDSYYVVTFTLRSARKDSWIDSTIRVNKSEAKVIAPRGFFAER